MCFTLRNTTSRGRSADPLSLRRMRLWIRSRMSFFESRAMLLRSSARAGLADLLAQRFAGVTHALVLVRIGRTQRAHIRGHLAQQLAIRTRQHQMRLLIDFEIDSVRQIEFDGVRITQREGRDAALHVATVADADDIQLAREAAGDALHRIRGQRARQPMQRGEFIAIALQFKRPVLLRERHARRHRNALLALGAFDVQLSAADLDLYALRQRNRFFAYSRHNVLPLHLNRTGPLILNPLRPLAAATRFDRSRRPKAPEALTTRGIKLRRPHLACAPSNRSSRRAASSGY